MTKVDTMAVQKDRVTVAKKVAMMVVKWGKYWAERKGAELVEK